MEIGTFGPKSAYSAYGVKVWHPRTTCHTRVLEWRLRVAECSEKMLDFRSLEFSGQWPNPHRGPQRQDIRTRLGRVAVGYDGESPSYRIYMPASQVIDAERSLHGTIYRYHQRGSGNASSGQTPGTRGSTKLTSG